MKLNALLIILTLGFSSVPFAQQNELSESSLASTINSSVWEDLGLYTHDLNSIVLAPASTAEEDSSVHTTVASSIPTEDILLVQLADAYSAASIAASNPMSDLLIWGHNNGDILPSTSNVTVNLSSDISSSLQTHVSYTRMQRIWKFLPISITGAHVQLRIPRESITSTSTEGNYYMFISDSGAFDSTSDFRRLTLDAGGYLVGSYNFNEMTYISFGYSPIISEERSIFFNGANDYIDINQTLDLDPSGFTISAWVNHEMTALGEASLVSKRDVDFSQGFDLTLSDEQKVRITWQNEGIQTLSSYTSIPSNEWHHIAVTYNGTAVSIYIDGVLDVSAVKAPPVSTQESFYIAAAGTGSPLQHYKGHIDEIRLWNRSLAPEQLRFIMNQEIANHDGLVMGKALPASITKNDIISVPWQDLAAYYPMSKFSYRTLIDASEYGHDGRLQQLLSVDKETAPLPYISAQDGDWDDSSSWVSGSNQYAPGSTSLVHPNTTIDWTIVHTSHNLSLSNASLPSSRNHNRTVLGLSVDANELRLLGDTAASVGNGLTVTHYLSLSGTIDLEGESQLIQTKDSDLEVFGNGSIEIDQQGTSDTYTYNYWSSPVTRQNSTATSYRIMDVMKDGTDPTQPQAINFLSSGYNGSATHPIGIADYWIWKYANHPSNSYSSWQHIRRTGTIYPGEGFTMKGPGTGSILTPQNYVFHGQPNNGDINLSLSANNDYLVGNPYPSTIDAVQFILDNGPRVNEDHSLTSPLITGTLYFWNHWGGGSHVLQDYQGGYATYNLSGAVAAAYKGNSYAHLNISGSPTKVPSRAIPVGQGFFVLGLGSGLINFNNGQRIFKTENDDSLLMRASNSTINPTTSSYSEVDLRMKFRIGFESVNTIRRQLLLTIDDQTTSGVDWAYDGALNEVQIDDMFWIINDDAYVIQASNEAEVSSVYPIGITTISDGMNTITLDALEHVPDTISIYVHDAELNVYHDLRTGDYNVFLNAGDYLDRFKITFGTQEDLLGVDDEDTATVALLYSNAHGKLVLVNPNAIAIKSIHLYNMLGQSVYTLNQIDQVNYSEYSLPNLSPGAYITTVEMTRGALVSGKVVVGDRD